MRVDGSCRVMETHMQAGDKTDLDQLQLTYSVSESSRGRTEKLAGKESNETIRQDIPVIVRSVLTRSTVLPPRVLLAIRAKKVGASLRVERSVDC